MRSAITVLVVLVSGTLVWAPAAAAPPGCTEVGTPARDVMAGSGGRDVLCTLGGGDYAHGGNGNDVIIGGSGGDTLIGGNGADRIQGAGGDDRIFSVDNRTADVVRGGRGFDSCFGDRGDSFRGCERRFRTGTSPAVDATIAALTDALFELTVLGEELQDQIDELIAIIFPPTPIPPPGPPHAECPPTVTDESPPPCV